MIYRYKVRRDVGNMSFKRFYRYQLILCLFSFGAGIFLCNYTEDILSKPAVNVMRFASGKNGASPEIDERGIPKVFYPRLGRSFYNPVHIASNAIGFYQQRNDPERGKENLKRFLEYADWLKNNLRMATYEGFAFGVWQYHFYWANYELKPPWRSGMAQGAGLDVLNKAYEITRDPSYLNSAKLALNAFLVDVKNGGVTYQDAAEDWWFEEYAGSDGIESRVLNGAMYALIDVYEFWKKTGDTTARDVYRKGLNGIRKHLPEYDKGWWSYYDAIGTIATKKYHDVHIELTKKLYDISGQEIFLEYSERWAGYKDSYFIREFVKQRPDYHDLVILGLNILGVWVMGTAVLGIFFFYRKTSRSHS